ncbi:hypothetical protein IAG44_11965 [Streptomyces roseirectus]|uniref:Uncharacterized protein n=1 Tax=Streptomyces roseirectus TaxID=2768066 RepID=A0A7H0IBC9_9ACTN|nr:hypothetical protein [Streptomyces roseirectus]QNP70095.1 hypothetical protein IAG44_11965 [Streptomyces roseirectus]
MKLTGVQSASAEPDQTEYSTVTIHTRPVSRSERASFCPNGPADDIEPAPAEATTQGADLTATPKHADD